ncbi:MAG TPA: flagellar hook-associated protein FlgL [Steroidobacteraceae bacterium]|nr:flagellar hook-associated protein FlgL [Steroidobacteraceae bacterium]
MRISTPMVNQLALNGIMQDESALTSTESHLSTGLSINSPADNPVGEVELLQLTATSSQYQQYLSNGKSAGTNLNLEEQALTTSGTTLQSIQSLVIEANNGSNSTSDLQSIATQIQQLEQQLLGTANSTNATGQYLFAGYSVNTQPFVRSSSGSVSYVGDAGVSSVALDGDSSVQSSDAGSSVFMNVPTGNGTFTTTAAAGNTGTGVIDPGGVTDRSLWTPDQYTITFTDATDYQVTDSQGNLVTQGTYNPTNGQSIAFKGVDVGISGGPAAGDTFTVSPSSTNSVFDTLDSLVNSLQNAASSSASRAQLSSSLATSLRQIGNAMSRISNVNTSVGTRISMISSLNASVTSQSTTVTTQISNIDSLDYAAATSQYSQQYLALQAAEQSFAQLGQLSLFKYL